MRKKNLQTIDNKNQKEEPSVAIVSLNAQATIEKTLQRLKNFQEIVVVDNGSTDKTIEIAKKYTKKIYINPIKNLRKLREYALKKITRNWVLFIDTDEILTKENQKKLLNLWQKYKEKFDGFWLARRNYYGGGENDYLKHGLFYPDFQLRLFKRKYRYLNTPHEVPGIPLSKTYYCHQVEIYHYQDKKLFSLTGLKKLLPLSKTYAKEFVNKSLVSLLFKSFYWFFNLFFVSLIRGRGIFDGYYGIIASFNFACHISFIYLYALYLKLKRNY